MQGKFVITCNVMVGLIKFSFCKKIIQWWHWCNKQWFETVGLTQVGNRKPLHVSVHINLKQVFIIYRSSLGHL